MTDPFQKLQTENTILNNRCTRQASIIETLHKQVKELEETKEPIPYIYCFFAMPFKEECNIVFNAVKNILEEEPYGWKVIRADKEQRGLTISSNVESHITNSDCYIADVSEMNPNVLLEIGRMSCYKKGNDVTSNYFRPIIYLCCEDRKDDIPSDLGGYIFYTYALSSSINLLCLSTEIKQKLETDLSLKSIREKKKKEIYLSPDLLVRHSICNAETASRIAEEYKTVESFCRVDPSTIVERLRLSRQSIPTIFEIRHHLEDHFKLSPQRL